MTVKVEGKETLMDRVHAFRTAGDPSEVEVLNRGQRNKTKHARSVGQEDVNQRDSRGKNSLSLGAGRSVITSSDLLRRA